MPAEIPAGWEKHGGRIPFGTRPPVCWNHRVSPVGEQALFFAVFAHIDRNRDRDDDPFDDLLPHRGNVDKLQAVLDD